LKAEHVDYFAALRKYYAAVPVRCRRWLRVKQIEPPWNLQMVHAYHLIWGTYGFWLPIDPRGSWSQFVASWELVRFGKSTLNSDRIPVDREQLQAWRNSTRLSLKYPPVEISGEAAKWIGEGFGSAAAKSGYRIWACSILPQHVHLFMARHKHGAKQASILLKGEATKSLFRSGVDILSRPLDRRKKAPSLWAKGLWKVFLDTDEGIENAIRYVEENPVKEGKPPQKWKFVTPFEGLGDGGFMSYL
jgi:REP element-mobilizing transposase RayT